ncbi:MAG TPA: aldo/keto reductase [Planctomycetota bacterium]|nr:aldo/keto reductase [Planctomycetota bacterium]
MPRNRMTRREFVRDTAVATAAVAAAGAAVAKAPEAGAADASKVLNHNPNMEYRRCGKTGLMVSAVCLGGHWKRINEVVKDAYKGGNWLSVDPKNPNFLANRTEIVSRCIDVGINYIDACTHKETLAYSHALKGRRDKMYLGYSWYEHELRNGQYRTAEKLLQSLDEGMKLCGLDYVDLWRVTMHEQSHKHAAPEVEQMMKALETAKKQGKARFTGFSSHARPHIQKMIETYPNVVDIIVTPYTAKTKEAPKDSLFDALKKHDVGMFGIKPFASGSLFKAGGAPAGPDAEEDDRRARLAIRYILCNPAITAPIPGMVSTHQVDNVALAIKERKENKELTRAERDELDAAMNTAWANLPHDYQWLKDWEHV